MHIRIEVKGGGGLLLWIVTNQDKNIRQDVINRLQNSKQNSVRVPLLIII